MHWHTINAYDLLKNEGRDNSICAVFDCKTVSRTRRIGVKGKDR